MKLSKFTHLVNDLVRNPNYEIQFNHIENANANIINDFDPWRLQVSFTLNHLTNIVVNEKNLSSEKRIKNTIPKNL